MHVFNALLSFGPTVDAVSECSCTQVCFSMPDIAVPPFITTHGRGGVQINTASAATVYYFLIQDSVQAKPPYKALDACE